MNKETEKKLNNAREEFIKQVELKESRKLKSRQDTSQNVWLGFVKYGVIGWSVAIPTLAGVAAGLWLDKNYPCTHSWTLSLMALGLFTGCACAWRWMENEEIKIKKDTKDKR